MPSTLLRSAVLLGLLLATPGAASASFRGYVERPYTPTTCLQESHFLTDPCTDSLTLLEDDRAILDLYLCKHVIVDGPDVGIECQVIAPASVQRVQPACPIPRGHRVRQEKEGGGPHVGMEKRRSRRSQCSPPQ